MPKQGPKSDPALAAAIGRRILLRREMLGLTQEQVAIGLGFGRNNLSYIESGRVIPTGITIPKLCRALEMTPNWLFGWDED